jgi:hypothetical protein
MKTKRWGERGQGIILFVGFMTVVFVIAAVAIDFSLYLSERRGAQKDADASSLAGAYELLGQDFVNIGNNDFTAIQTAAENAAYDWADRNGVPAPDVHNLAVTDSDCFGASAVLDSVALDAEHHSKALFSSIFGLSAPEIGAHARVCLGSIISAEGLLPVGVQVEGFDSDCWDDMDIPPDGFEDPIYGAECTLTFGGGDFTSGEGGALNLYNDGSLNCSGNNTGGGRTYRDELSEGGAETTCYVLPQGETCDTFPQGCVWPQTGNLVGQERIGFSDLISGEGDCDALYGNDANSIDDFDEVVSVASGGPGPSTTTVYTERDCDLSQVDTQRSPRLVSLIIVEQFTAQGNPPKPILAFAGFYIKQCESDDDPPQVSEVCDFQAIGNPGKIIVRGQFINFVVTKGTVGSISKWSPKRIILTE